jgi:hypothetical protein
MEPTETGPNDVFCREFIPIVKTKKNVPMNSEM